MSELYEFAKGTQARINVIEVGDVVAFIAQRARVERQQPNGIEAQAGDVGQPIGEAAEIAHAITIAVLKSLYFYCIDNGVFEPQITHGISRAVCPTFGQYRDAKLSGS